MCQDKNKQISKLPPECPRSRPSKRMNLYSAVAILLVLLSTKVECHLECHSSQHNAWLRDVEDESCSRNSTNDDARIHDPTGWRWKYIDEQTPEFLALVQDDTLDGRLANLIYASNSARFVNIDPFTHNQGDAETDQKLERLAADSRVDHQLCGAQLAQMLHLFADMAAIVRNRRLPSHAPQPLTEKHNRLAKLLDSFGRPGAGLHTGRSVFLGSHLQCQDSRLLLSGEDGNVSRPAGRYCVAKLDLSRHLHPTLRARPPHPHEQRLQLAVGVCLPETCHSASFHAHGQLIKRLLESQFELPETMYVDRHLELADLYCPPTGDSPLLQLSIGGKLFIAATLVWLAIIFYVTFLTSQLSPKRSSASWLSSFNLRQSWDDFCGCNRSPKKNRIELDVLNPIKVVGCLLVVTGHSLIIRAFSSHNVARTNRTIEQDPWVHLLIASTVVVDTFYVITGILMVYLTMRRFKSKIESSPAIVGDFFRTWSDIAGSRFLRLVPLYFIVYWFKRSIYINLSAGPLWDHGINMDTENGACLSESWLTPVTFMSAYLSLSKQCLPQAWSVAGDLFFFVLFAPIAIMLICRPRLAISTAFAFAIASNVAMLKEVGRMDPLLSGDLEELRIHALAQVFNRYSYTYTAPHYRLSSFLIGVLAGYVLFHFSEGKKLRKWPDWFKGPATWFSWISVVLIALAPVSIPLFRDTLFRKYPLHHNVFEHCMTTSRFIWASSNAVLMLRMMTDWKDSFLMRNSAGSFWRSMANLNLAILLVHMDLLILDVQSQESLTLYSKFNVLSLAAATYVFSCLVAVVLHVVVENPIDKVIKRFTR